MLAAPAIAAPEPAPFLSDIAGGARQRAGLVGDQR